MMTRYCVSLKSAYDKVRAPGILRIGGLAIDLADWFGPWPYQSTILNTQWGQDLQSVVWDLWETYDFPYPYNPSPFPSEEESYYLAVHRDREQRRMGILFLSDEDSDDAEFITNNNLAPDSRNISVVPSPDITNLNIAE